MHAVLNANGLKSTYAQLELCAGNVHFRALDRDRWFTTVKQPKLGVPYIELVYKPMLELLDYLRAHELPSDREAARSIRR